MAEQTVMGGRYELIRLLGHGGMADVYLGSDRVLNRRVAVKILSSQYARDASFVARFRREAQAAAALNHPNLVSVYDTGSDNGTQFIVLEYIEGMTLAQVIAEHAPLSAERTVRVADSVAAGLSLAHGAGIIHRDIKPGNIMLASGGTVKVMDFGIARAQTSEALTQTATVLGTAAYVSPEQAQGGHVDARSDLYSLGCVMYEMLTGGPPFSADTPLALAYKHVREEPEPPSRKNPSVPAALDAIVLKCLAKNPDNRYQSSGELREDLRRFREGQPVEATPLLTPPPPAPAAARTQALPRPPRSTAVLPAQPRYTPVRRRRGWVGPVILITILAALGVGFFFLARSLLENNDPELITVENVVGELVGDARAILIEQGFVPDVQRVQDEEIPLNIVIDYDPKEAVAGATITLTVSNGPAPPPLVAVPPVVCKSQQQAIADIEGAGLVAEVSEDTVENADCQPGQVGQQSPEAGVEVEEDSTVTIFLVAEAAPPAAPSAPNLASGSDSGASDSDEITNQTTLTLSGTADSGVTVTLFRDGAARGTDVANANGDWSITDSGLGQGSFDYTARAQAEDGQTSGFSDTTTVTVDTTGPSVEITSAPPDGTIETTATFEFTAGEDVAGFECQLDGGGFSACSSGQTYEGLLPGPHTFEVRATDVAGNTSDPASYTWNIVV